MNTKENFFIKHFFYWKSLVDLFSIRLFVICLLFATLPFFSLFHISVYDYFGNTHWMEHFIMQPFSAYFNITTIVFCFILGIRIFLDIALSIGYHIAFRCKNSSLAKSAYAHSLRNAKEYDYIAARAILLRIEKPMRTIIIVFSCLLLFTSCFPIYKAIIIECYYFPKTIIYNCLVAILGTTIFGLFPGLFGSLLILLINTDYKKLMSRHMKQPSSFNSLSGINFDFLSGAEFEAYCAELLSHVGYERIFCTPLSCDQGVDLTAFKNKCKYAIQCKRYKYPVGNKAIQEVVAGMKMYDCQKAIVITNSNFTSAAISLARANNVELIDRKGLFKLLQAALLTPDSKCKK